MSLRLFSLVTVVAAGLLMSACSPINSEFSCNATAGDSCMTIEQVDAMTRYADGARAQQKRGDHANPYAKNNNDHALVWVAPQTPNAHAHG